MKHNFPNWPFPSHIEGGNEFRVRPMTVDDSRVRPMTTDDSRVIPMTVDNSRVIPMTVDHGHYYPMTDKESLPSWYLGAED